MPKAVELTETIKAGKAGSVVLKDSLLLIEKNFNTAKGGGYAGISTGIEELDKTLGGLQTGLHILAAQPGAGKTALALNIVRHCSRQGYPVVYASFDEVPERLLIKIIAAETGLDVGKLFGGATDPKKFIDAANDYGHSQLNNLSFISAGMNLNVQDFKAQLSDQIVESTQDTGLLVVDYLQPWAASIAVTQGIDYRQAVGQAAQMLRSLANDLNIPVLMISAQNRTGQDSKRMTSLRESSELEYSADSILLITTDDDKCVGQDRYARTLTIAKNRFGPSDKFINIMLNGKTQEVTGG